MKKCHIFSLILFSLLLSAFPLVADANVLGTAGEFNTFIFGNYACTSDAEGRVAVGGNMTAGGYSVADKLNPEEVERADYDILIVKGKLTYSSGRVYYGNIRAGGKVKMPSSVPDGELITKEPIPIDFAAEQESLTSLSTALSQIPANVTAEAKWGGLYLTGDGTNALQVFHLDGSQVLNAHTFDVKNIASGATVLFNISGTTAGLTNMSMESLTSHQNKTLFNFYEAATLTLGGIAVRGSILAPLADIDNPQGVIWGTVIAKSWNGAMQQNHVPFTGDLPISEPTPEEPEASCEPGPETATIALQDNKDSTFKVEFVSHVGDTWTYRVSEIKGRSLSHWDLGVTDCVDAIGNAAPSSGFEPGKDGSTGFYGIKWNTADSFSSGEFSFTVNGEYTVGTVEVLAKAGNNYAVGTIVGPICGSCGSPEPTPEPSCAMWLNEISSVGDGNPWTSNTGNSAWWASQNGASDEITLQLDNITSPVSYRWELNFPTDHSNTTELVDGYQAGTKVYNKGEGIFSSDGTHTISIPYPTQGQWGAPSLDGYGTYESHMTLWIDGPCDDQNWDHWYKAPWQSDLSIKKTAAAQADVGETLAYTIIVTNNGPQNAQVYEGRGVKLTDTLPEGVTLLSVAPSQGTCDDTIACDLGALNYLQSARVDVNVRVDAAGTLINTATVSPERPGDPDLSNNTSSVETTVKAPQPATPPDVLLIGINDDKDRFEIYNTATKEKTFPTAFEIVLNSAGQSERVEAQKVPDEIESLVYVGDGVYYGIQSYNKSQNTEKTSQLYKFTLNHDTTEITIEKVGEAFSGTDIDAIEYGDGVFYAMDNRSDKLLVIDMDGNIIASKKVKDLGLTKVEGLAYHDGLLYASDTDALIKDGYSSTPGDAFDADSALFSINVVNGLDDLQDGDVEYIGQLGFGQVEGLTFVDDILYGTSDIHDSLFMVDLGTGFGTYMDDWGNDIEGIAAVHPGSTAAAVPEPGTLLLLGIGVLGGAYLRRKRQS